MKLVDALNEILDKTEGHWMAINDGVRDWGIAELAENIFEKYPEDLEKEVSVSYGENGHIEIYNSNEKLMPIYVCRFDD